MVELFRLRPKYEVDRLDADMEPRTCVPRAADPAVYPNFQDMEHRCAEDRDDLASNSTWASSASTMTSWYSDRSFASDLSQRSDPPPPSKSSTTSPSDVPEENEQGDASSASGSIGAASATMPPRKFRHARTRSGQWTDSAEKPPEVPLDDRGAGSLSSSADSNPSQCSSEDVSWNAPLQKASPMLPPSSWRRSSKIRFACPLAEVAPIEEHEEEMVPEEPAAMAPAPWQEPVVIFEDC